MVCLLTFNPVVSHFGVAEANSTVFTEGASAGLERMFDLQGSLKGYGAEKISGAKSNDVANEGQKFINGLSKKDKAILNTPKGARFLKEHTRLMRSKALQKKLVSCAANEKSKRQLDKQILGAIERIDTSTYKGGCDYNLIAPMGARVGSTSLEDFTNDLGRLQRAFNNGRANGPAKLQNAIYMESLKNSFSSYLAVKYRYDKDFINPETGAISKKHLDKSIADICKRKTGKRVSRNKYSYNQCSSSQEKELRNFAKEKAIEIAATQVKTTDMKAVGNSLKATYKDLDEKLEKVKVGVDYSGIDGADLENPVTRKAWEDYHTLYLEKLSGTDKDPEGKVKQQCDPDDPKDKNKKCGHGMLMMTPSVKELFGGVKQLDKDVKNTGGWVFGKEYEITKHKHDSISEKQAEEVAKKAVDDIVKATIEEAKNLNEMAYQKKNQENRWKSNKYRDDTWTGTDHGDVYDQRNEDLKTLIRTNPTAVGQALMGNPELADIVCDLIKEIDAEDAKKESNDSIATWGAIFVGGLLVGGLIACTIITFGVCGAAVAAAAAAIGTSAAVLTAVGTTTLFVVGGAEAAYWGNRMYGHNKEHRAMERAILSDNMDPSQATAVENSMHAFKDARFNMLMALPAVVLPGVGKLASLSKGNKMLTALKSFKGSPKAKALFMDNMAAIYKAIGKSPKLQKGLDFLISSGRLSADKLNDFFILLGKGKGAVNEKALRWLSKNLEKFKNTEAGEKGMRAFMAKFADIVDEGLAAANKACKI
tara:strand:- start:21322 stop:23607 length:2286 start_codon:yes stop_codon:yes gene_type:complete